MDALGVLQDEFVQVLRWAPSLRYLDYSGYTCDMPEEVATALCSGVQRVHELYLQTTNKVELLGFTRGDTPRTSDCCSMLAMLASRAVSLRAECRPVNSFGTNSTLLPAF